MILQDNIFMGRIERFNFLSLIESEDEGKSAAPEEKSAEPEVPPPPPVITYSEDELAAAKLAARETGRQEGIIEGQKRAQNESDDLNRRLSSLLDRLAASLPQASAHHYLFLEEQKQQTSRLALTLARKVASHALKENALAEIEAMVGDCLLILMGEPRITVTVHPDLAAPLRARIDTALTKGGKNFEGELKIESDPACPQEDCRIEWKNGAASRNTAQIWQEMESLLNRHQPAETPPAQKTEPTPQPPETGDPAASDENAPLYIAKQ